MEDKNFSGLGYPLVLDCSESNILLPENFDDENNNIALIGVDAEKIEEVLQYMQSTAKKQKLTGDSKKKISDLT